MPTAGHVRSGRSWALPSRLTSVLALAGCGTFDATATKPKLPVGATANGNPPPPSAAVSATKFSRLPDPLAPTMTKVKRGAGSAPKSKVNAAAEPFTKAVSYSDGVVVTVSRIAQSTESG